MPASAGRRPAHPIPGRRRVAMVPRRCLVAVLLVLAGPGVAADAAGAGAVAVLALPGGEITGRLVGAEGASEGDGLAIRWQSDEFAGPFLFPLGRIGGIRFDGDGAEASGRWHVELTDGDVVAGTIDSIDPTHVSMSIGSAATPVGVSVRRDGVRRIAASGPATVVWNGGLDGVRVSAAQHWLAGPAGLGSSTPGATAQVAVADSPRMRYDLALAWERPPRVRLSFGPVPAQATDDPTPREAPYRIELADEGLIVVRDEARPDGTGDADIEPCGSLPEGGLTLSVFIDRPAGRMVVHRTGDPTALADLAIEPIRASPTRSTAAGGADGGDAGGFRCELVSGAVTVAGLRASPWRGVAAGADDDGIGAVETLDGGRIAGSVVASSDDGHGVVVTIDGPPGTAPRSVPIDAVAAIGFPAGKTVTPARGVAASRRVRLGDRLGSSLVAELVDVTDEGVTIAHPAFEATVTLPFAALRSIVPGESADGPAACPGRVGRLRIGDATHDGCLVSIGGDATAGGEIGWMPRGSLVAAALARDTDGNPAPATIRYRESSPDGGDDDLNGWIGVTIEDVDGRATITEVIPGGPLQPFGVTPPAHLRAVAPRGDDVFVRTAGLPIEDVLCLVQGRAGTAVQLRIAQGPLSIAANHLLERGIHPFWGRDRQRLREVLETQERLLARATAKDRGPDDDRVRSIVVLETGESFEGHVEGIDERGVRLIRAGADPVTIPSVAVKAVELVPGPGTVISAEKFRSLSTLPRAQRHSPPTHLVRSLRGDYLRGRLEAMDGDTLRLTVDADPRGRPIAIPRRDVARVIWLHPESLDAEWRPAPGQLAPGLPVEVVGADGHRLRLAVTCIEGDALVGIHPVLGPARLDLATIDRILVGGVLEASPKLPPYAQWRLQPAAEPRNLPRKPPSKP